MRKIVGFIDKYDRTICRHCGKFATELKHVIKPGAGAVCEVCHSPLELEATINA